ncbi:VWA domain-containing protein [Variovorax dokdonensis]|uniref:VWA domain-containing protein n=1 Tax=Variovorax dokdonensis TaxID=344883 RepID=A0ABT7NH17_9BURK|nr:VWA domain-containing protein [Variovorax dokdonensis]MDM0047200.1 VWA domain-containing protein [Variovorax dokdonensis]
MYQLEYPWLLALLPLPLLVWWLLPAYREESASIRLPFFGEVARAVGARPAAGAVVPRTNWLQKVLAPLAWALLVLALARPQFVEPPLEKVQPARDLLLALDLSQSMATRDFTRPDGVVVTRAEAVQQVVRDFVARRKTDRIGLIVFGDAPYPQAPFTMDHALIEALIGESVPGMAGPRTAVGDAIGLGMKLFEHSEAPQKVLIVLTDGNDTASKMPPERAAAIAKQRKVTVHTIGIGNPSATGEDKVDLATLRSISAATGGQFFFAGNQGELERVYATLDSITPQNHKTLTWRPRHELYMWPVGAAVLIVIAYQLIMAMLMLVRRWMVPRNLDEAIEAASADAIVPASSGGQR